MNLHMAAVSIPPSPQAPSTMTSRRVPLANNPNAANSPFRAVTTTAATKRSRSHASDQRELTYGQPPPAKKQIIEVEDQEARRNALLRKAGYNAPTSFQKKLEALRDSKPAQKTPEKNQRVTSENLESIRQWQKHYRKAFPQFVFYFESIPDEVRIKASRQVQSLGAREEKFFSRAVTHVVTTRPIPPEPDPSSAEGRSLAPKGSVAHDTIAQSRTINPSLLERSRELQNLVQQKSKSAFDAALQKKSQIPTQSIAHEVEARKQQSNNGDILYKAREMGMKIWALEKLQRMMTTMFNTETGEQAPQPRTTRSNATLVPTKAGQADLSQLLQNEKLNGPADRDWSVATQDMGHFRGYYIYIHDMDEKTRPVMIRDYPKPPTKEEGKWPQFRLTAPGRCPFVEDVAAANRIRMEEQQQQKANQLKVKQAQGAAPRTRAAAAALEAAKQQAPVEDTERPALVENNNLAARPSTATSQQTDGTMSKPLDPPKLIPAKRSNPDSMPLFGSAQASLRSMPRFAGGEPVASGVQPSNVTSAIRSQMISSTAAQPNKATASKQFQQLSRKALEKNSALSANSMGSSYMNDIRAAINGDRGAPPRAAKRKAQDTLTQIHEDMTLSEEEENARRMVAPRKKKVVQRELKPGYCENCREKFDDFDEHVLSRKHRKFALTPENWKELDELLGQLGREKKEL